MAKRLKLFGITYLVGKISRSNFFFQGPLAEWENHRIFNIEVEIKKNGKLTNDNGSNQLLGSRVN